MDVGTASQTLVLPGQPVVLPANREIPPEVSVAIRHLPKAELHTHLQGCCPGSLWSAHYGETPGFDDFSGLMRAYDEVSAALYRAGVSIFELLRAVVNQAQANHARYIEPALSASHLESDIVAVGLPVMAQRLRQAAEQAASRGVHVGLMIMAHRHNPPEVVRRHMQIGLALAAAGAPVVSVGCAGGGNLTTLEQWGRIWDELGGRSQLPLVPHAGELVPGAETFEDLHDALGVMPRRIAHGVQAVLEPELLSYLAAHQICCDVAISSNELLGNTAASQHPIVTMVRAGVPCSINTDDSLLLGCSLNSEYELAWGQGLSLRELLACAQHSVRHGGAGPLVRRRILQEQARWAHRFGRLLQTR
jgi:adenosine deaminase